MKKTVLAILVIVFATAINAVGEGTTGAQFLGIGIGARACAMGKAYGALADDPSGIYWNPAGLSKIGSKQVMISQNFWLVDMTQQYLAGVLPRQIGTFGLSIQYSSSGSIPKIEDYIKVGDYSAYDAAVNLAFANKYHNSLNYGIGVKYIMQKIDTESASTFALDLGVIYEFNKYPGLNLALALQNIGPGIKFIEETDKLPTNIKLASSYAQKQYTLCLELDKETDSDIMFGLGGEYIIKEVLALRGGYNTAHSISLGFGITWRQFDLNYCFAPNKDLDASHRFTLQARL